MSNLQQNFRMFCCFTTDHFETRKPCLENLVSNEVYWLCLDSNRAFLLIFSFKPCTYFMYTLCIPCYKSLLTQVFTKLLDLYLITEVECFVLLILFLVILWVNKDYKVHKTIFQSNLPNLNPYFVIKTRKVSINLDVLQLVNLR